MIFPSIQSDLDLEIQWNNLMIPMCSNECISIVSSSNEFGQRVLDPYAQWRPERKGVGSLNVTTTLVSTRERRTH